MSKEDWRIGPMGCVCLTGAELYADAKLRENRHKQKESKQDGKG